MEYPDNELAFYLQDNNEDAIDIVYDKYKYIIEVLINKYKRVFYALNIEMEEVKQEANLAFSYAIYNYDENFYSGYKVEAKWVYEVPSGGSDFANSTLYIYKKLIPSTNN